MDLGLGFNSNEEKEVSTESHVPEHDMATSEKQAHPAGRGDPAPLTPPSILIELASLDWAGIRFLRTHLESPNRGGKNDTFA